MAIKKPIIHLNGSSVYTLLNEYNEVRLSVQDSRDLLEKAAPHMRDYYPQPGDYEVALKEHKERVEKLNSVLKEIEEISEYLADIAYGRY